MELLRRINELMEEKIQNQEFSGVVLVNKDNKELFSGAYGYANRSFKVENKLETRFRVASVSKMFTAVSVLKLIEAGALAFTTKIREYLELNDSSIPEAVDIFSLLTHTSGIADYFDEENGDWDSLWKEKPIYGVRSLSDYYDMFKSSEPVSKVGERFKYNGAGYILLGMAIEKASGTSYSEYVKENIFKPSGMLDSDFTALDLAYENIAEGYIPVKAQDNKITGWKRNIYSITPEAASDGGAVCTAYDLALFLKALRGNQLLSKEMTNSMLAPQVLDQGSNGARGYVWKYGFANWFLLDDNENIVRGGHTGEEFGFSSRLYYYPQLGVDVIILANQDWCAGALGWKLHDLIIEHANSF